MTPEEAIWWCIEEGMRQVRLTPPVSERTFKELYLCEWKVDQRTIDLQDMLYKFYNDYEEVDNRMYIKAWRKLHDKLLRQGYSREEIIEAKKVVRTWRLKGE